MPSWPGVASLAAVFVVGELAAPGSRGDPALAIPREAHELGTFGAIALGPTVGCVTPDK